MIGSLASGANAFLVAKNGTKKIIPLLLIKSSPVDRFQSLRCLNNHINLPYMMGSLTSDPIMWGRSLWLLINFKHQNLSTGEDFFLSSGIIFLVPFWATKETLAPLANDPIM